MKRKAPKDDRPLLKVIVEALQDAGLAVAVVDDGGILTIPTGQFRNVVVTEDHGD